MKKKSPIEEQIAKAEALYELLGGEKLDEQSEWKLIWKMIWDSNSSLDDEERAAVFNSIINSPEKDDAYRKKMYAAIDERFPNAVNLKSDILFFKFSESHMPPAPPLNEENKVALFTRLLFEEKQKLNYDEEQFILRFFLENNIPLTAGPVINPRETDKIDDLSFESSPNELMSEINKIFPAVPTAKNYITILSAFTISLCVMAVTFFIPPAWKQPAELFVSLFGFLLLVYFSEHTALVTVLTFSWIVFFDLVGKHIFQPDYAGISVLQAGGHLLGAAILTYLLIKMVAYLKLNFMFAGRERASSGNCHPKVSVRAIKKAFQNLNTGSILYYLLTIVVLPGANLTVFFLYPGFLLPCLLLSLLLLGWALSSLVKFDDINFVVIAVGVYGLATLAVPLLVFFLLGSTTLLLVLLVPGVYVGSTVSKNVKELLEMVDAMESLEDILAQNS